MANIFQDIEKSAIGFKSEDDIKGLFDNLDTEATSLVELFQKKINAFLTFLMVSIALTLGNFEENDIDAFGDAYEFLISNYASNAGKGWG